MQYKSSCCECDSTSHAAVHIPALAPCCCKHQVLNRFRSSTQYRVPLKLRFSSRRMLLYTHSTLPTNSLWCCCRHRNKVPNLSLETLWSQDGGISNQTPFNLLCPSLFFNNRLFKWLKTRVVNTFLYLASLGSWHLLLFSPD